MYEDLVLSMWRQEVLGFVDELWPGYTADGHGHLTVTSYDHRDASYTCTAVDVDDWW